MSTYRLLIENDIMSKLINDFIAGYLTGKKPSTIDYLIMRILEAQKIKPKQKMFTIRENTIADEDWFFEPELRGNFLFKGLKK